MKKSYQPLFPSANNSMPVATHRQPAASPHTHSPCGEMRQTSTCAGEKPPASELKTFQPLGFLPEAVPKRKSEPHQEEITASFPVDSSASQSDQHTGKRRKARELALQVLYAMEISGQEAQESIRRIGECFRYPESVWEYAKQIILGVKKHQKKIDLMIQQSSEHWRLNRMACVDRNLLRLAVFELMFCPDIPKKVALNEAVDLGKKFGSEDSGAFVNGVLDRVATSLEK